MSSAENRCEQPIEMETLVDYFGDALDESEEDAVETHLFQCAWCSRESERLAGLLGAVASNVPPVISSTRFAELERRGRIQKVNVMTAGQITEARYPESGRLLVHRLGGVDLSATRRVDLDIHDTEGREIVTLTDVPFDRERGEVVIACQRHFAETFPRNLVFTVARVSDERSEVLGRYTVAHRLV